MWGQAHVLARGAIHLVCVRESLMNRELADLASPAGQQATGTFSSASLCIGITSTCFHTQLSVWVLEIGLGSLLKYQPVLVSFNLFLK